MAKRSPEQLEVHAAQQRKYRRQAKRRHDEAMAQLGAAARVLLDAGMSPGEILDAILAVKKEG